MVKWSVKNTKEIPRNHNTSQMIANCSVSKRLMNQYEFELTNLQVQNLVPRIASLESSMLGGGRSILRIEEGISGKTFGGVLVYSGHNGFTIYRKLQFRHKLFDSFQFGFQNGLRWILADGSQV